MEFFFGGGGGVREGFKASKYTFRWRRQHFLHQCVQKNKRVTFLQIL